MKSDSLIETLDWNEVSRAVIAVVGAGGKTSTIFQLAKEFSKRGLTVGITTTTHMKLEEGPLAQNKSQILHQLNHRKNIHLQNSITDKYLDGRSYETSLIIAGIPTSEGKMKSLDPDDFLTLCELVDIVLVEADGSKRLPLKVPASYEPVLPKEVDHVLLVAGLSSIGRTIESTCHRPELVGNILQAELSHTILPEDVAKLLKEGYLYPLGNIETWKVILNQADTEDRVRMAMEIGNELRPYGVLITRYNVKELG